MLARGHHGGSHGTDPSVQSSPYQRAPSTAWRCHLCLLLPFPPRSPFSAVTSAAVNPGVSGGGRCSRRQWHFSLGDAFPQWQITDSRGVCGCPAWGRCPAPQSQLGVYSNSKNEDVFNRPQILRRWSCFAAGSQQGPASPIRGRGTDTHAHRCGWVCPREPLSALPAPAGCPHGPAVPWVPFPRVPRAEGAGVAPRSLARTPRRGRGRGPDITAAAAHWLILW